MDKPISDMDKQLQGADRVSLFIAMESHKARRNAFLFLSILAVAVIWYFTWNKWLFIIPAALGLGFALAQSNIAVISAELKRRADDE